MPNTCEQSEQETPQLIKVEYSEIFPAPTDSESERTQSVQNNDAIPDTLENSTLNNEAASSADVPSAQDDDSSGNNSARRSSLNL